MSGILSAAALTTLERILTTAGPLVIALIGKGDQKAATAVLDATSTAIEYARLTVKGAEHFAGELRDIADEMEAIKDKGGSTEADFDLMADRISEKTKRLKAAVAARAAK